jgi:hypothetical protein
MTPSVFVPGAAEATAHVGNVFRRSKTLAPARPGGLNLLRLKGEQDQSKPPIHSPGASEKLRPRPVHAGFLLVPIAPIPSIGMCRMRQGG